MRNSNFPGPETSAGGFNSKQSTLRSTKDPNKNTIEQGGDRGDSGARIDGGVEQLLEDF